MISQRMSGIDGLIHHRIRFFVEFASHMSKCNRVKMMFQVKHLEKQYPERRVFYFVLPVQLLYCKFGIQTDIEMRNAEFVRLGQPDNDTSVLSDVIGRVQQIFANLGKFFTHGTIRV